VKAAIVMFLFITSSAAHLPVGKRPRLRTGLKTAIWPKVSLPSLFSVSLELRFLKDLKTGLLWGDRITTDFNHYGSPKACTNDLTEANFYQTKTNVPTGPGLYMGWSKDLT